MSHSNCWQTATRFAHAQWCSSRGCRGL